MSIALWILRPAAAVAAAFCLTGCPSVSERPESPPTLERADALARQGDPVGAAKVYEALAAQINGPDRNQYVFRAAREYLNGRQPEEATRALASAQQPLSPQLIAEKAVLEVEITLARGQPQQAWQQINAVAEPRSPVEAARYLKVKERVAFAAGRPVDAVAAGVALERWLPNSADLRQGRLDLLAGLRDASEHGVKVDTRAVSDAVVRGWLELGPLAAAAAQNPVGALPGIESWRARNPNHAANEVVRTELLGRQQTRPVQAQSHVALLLPVTGRQAAAGTTVRDGFMSAYYQTPPADRPLVRVYDTADGGITDAIARATQAGAEFIVGPLTRDEVTAAASIAAARPPLLALNFLPADRAAPAMFYQFALSPEDEARSAARRILEEGHHRGIAFVPSGEWGSRVLAAFRQEIEAGGGSLIATATIDAGQTDYSDAVTQALKITDSRARHKRLESILGTKLQFEPRRRGDIEYIFAPAQANIERLLRPQLRFHYAGDVPTYATSDAFEPDSRANQDLEGLMFPDMPWMLGGDLAEAVRTATREAWPTGGPRRGRLFAFGYDAYRLTLALRQRVVSDAVSIDGLTGRLSLDSERRVHRDLNWAQFRNGEIRVLPPPAAQAQAQPQAQ